MNVDKYLARIGFSGDPTPTIEQLNKLHALHVGSIAFENVNPYIGVRGTLALDELYGRIVEQKRGGGCYELNGLFCELLQRLGFCATLLPAKLYKGDAVDYASLHAVISVSVGNKLWYVDPGYGEGGVVYPLELKGGATQKQQSYFYRFTQQENGWVFTRSKTAKSWTNLLLIDQTPVSLSYFDERALYHQTSPDSWFRKNFTCSVLSESSEKVLLNTKFTHFSPAKRTTTYIKTKEALFDLLLHTFGLELSQEVAAELFSKLQTKTLL